MAMLDTIKAAFVGAASPTLTPSEESRLAELRSVVRAGLRAWQAAAAALAEIRDKQLYRATHRSFAAYCEAEFELSPRRIRQLVSSWDTIWQLELASVAEPAEPAAAPSPPIDQLSEKAVRELKPLPLAERLAAIREAAAANPSRAPSPKAVRDVVRKRTGKAAMKPVRILVPGFSVIVTPNRKASGTVREALAAAIAKLDQLDQASTGADRKAA
jgi:hypothetical protein